MKVYNIIEVANTHDGDFDYLIELVDSFEIYKEGFGMKFQPLKYDEIAAPDFVNYENFKRFYFTPQQWQQIINRTAATKDVWLDVFDSYGVQIIQENLRSVKGIKFQASSLYNKKLIGELALLDLSSINLILNITAYEMEEIEAVVAEFENLLNVNQIILQIGFQDYPTKLLDSGLVKIGALKNHFSNSISFTEHVDGQSVESLWLPVFAVKSGASIIEKHVMHASRETVIDHYSSVKPDQYATYLQNLQHILDCFAQPFINAKEANYLASTIQIPILGNDKSSGTLINIEQDLAFKRTGRAGLRVTEVLEMTDNQFILRKDKKVGEVLLKSDFKKANIAAIVACRLKSKRLPQKATLKVGELSSIELCLKSTLNLSGPNYTILATSTLEEDASLENYCYSDQVLFHKGDPVDVIQRYLDIIDQLQLDVIVRITGDNPYISDEIYQILINSHFAKGADYTTATNAAPGTNVEIMNAAALRKIKQHFPRADYSEYMTWYFKNNPEHFYLNLVDLPNELSRNYRLSLDYQEDLDLLRKIEEYFLDNNLEHNTYRLFEYLDTNPEIANINKHLDFTFKTDQTLVDLLNKVTKIPA